MPKKTIPPRGQVAREHRNRNELGTHPLTPVIAKNFDVAEYEHRRLGERLAAYQEKLTQDYQRAIAAAEWAQTRAEALNDLFSDLEYFNSDGGVYAPLD